MDNYYASRFKFDPDRRKVWTEIVKYLGAYIPNEATVVDLGAGYCDFINLVKAQKKYAIDISDEPVAYKEDSVKFIQTPASDLSGLQDEEVDVVHASNLFEHFDDSELQKVISEVKRILKQNGRLILMQPNYRLTYKNYFDDYTHKKVWSDVSLGDFLVSQGFEILVCKPRFLPFSMKSSGLLPVFPMIVRAYLYSPFKPFAGQMLFVARKIQ